MSKRRRIRSTELIDGYSGYSYMNYDDVNVRLKCAIFLENFHTSRGIELNIIYNAAMNRMPLGGFCFYFGINKHC